MEVVVFGAGALGSLIGGLLARVHDVTLVGREPHVSRVRSDGLRISGAVEVHVEPAATTEPPAASDVALVTVKARDLGAATDALAAGDHSVVCPLTNGLPEDRLWESLGDRVLGGTATYGARLVGPGHVRCTGVGELYVGEVGSRGERTEASAEPTAAGDATDGPRDDPDEGSTTADATTGRDEPDEESTAADATTGRDDPTASDRARRVAAAMRAAGVACAADGQMDRRRWEKLAVNAGINAVTALARVENGALADGPAARVAERAAREVARVARSEGVAVADDRAVSRLQAVVDATAANRSSMLTDVERNRPTEVDAINGTVVERGDRAGVATPTNRTLAELVRAWEADHVG